MKYKDANCCIVAEANDHVWCIKVRITNIGNQMSCIHICWVYLTRYTIDDYDGALVFLLQKILKEICYCS